MATQGIGGGSGSGVGKEEGEGWPSYRIQKLLAPDTQWGMSRVKGDVKDTGMVAHEGTEQAVAAVARQQEHPFFALEGGASS